MNTNLKRVVSVTVLSAAVLVVALPGNILAITTITSSTSGIQVTSPTDPRYRGGSSTTPTPPAIFTITTLPGPSGYISPSGAISVPDGGDQSFSIIPFAGYKIDDVLIDGNSIGPIGFSNFTMVTANHTIQAVFSLIPPAPTYTITASAQANGFINPSGPVSVSAGSDQSFTISPSAGYKIQDVIIDGVSTGPIPYSTFTMVKGDHSIVAMFAAVLPASSTSDNSNESLIIYSPLKNVKASVTKKVETFSSKTTTSVTKTKAGQNIAK